MKKFTSFLIFCTLLSFVGLTQAPPNDLCVNAEAVICGTMTSGTTINATGGVASSCLGSRGDDVWYRFVGTGDEIAIIVDASAGSLEAQIDLYGTTDGSCDSTFCIDGEGTGQNPVTLMFTSTLNDVYYIAVGHWINGNPPGPFDLSLVCITCPAPTSLLASNPSASTIDLNWTDNAGASSWAIEYGPSGFTPGMGTTVLAGTNPYTLMGLSANTNYDAYVRAICSPGDTSLADGPESFSTTCTTETGPYCQGWEALGIAEQFNGGTLDCWTNVRSSEPEWRSEDGPTGSSSTGPDGPYSGLRYVYMESSSGSLGDSDTLTGPDIDVSGLTTPRLAFFYHMYGAEMGSLHWEVSDNGGSTWSNLGSLTGQQQTASSDPWIEVTEDLSSFGNTIRVRFIGIRGGACCTGDMAIDDVCVEETPSCPDPSLAMLDSATTSSLFISWNENGSATEWDLYYGLSPLTPPTAVTTPTESGVTVNSMYELTGLMSDSTYDIYVRAECGPDNFSPWSGPLLAKLFGPGDDCSNAIPIPVVMMCDTSNDVELDFSALDPIEYTSCDATGTNYGRWFSFVAPATGNINLVTTSTTSSEMAIFDACGGNEIYCYAGTLTADRLITGLTPSATYYLLVWEDTQTPITSFCVEEATSCQPLSNLTVDNITSSSADATWSGNATSTGFVIEYGPDGFTVGTGTQINTGPLGGTISMTSLSQNTDYDVYVWEICMGTETDTLGPVSFVTECGVQIASYCQGFELFGTDQQMNGQTIDCWSNVESSAPEWESEDLTTGSSGTGPDGPYEGSRYLYLECTGGAEFDTDTLFGPPVDVSALTNVELSFYYHMYGDSMGSLYWEVSDDGGSSWTQLGVLSGQQQTSESAPWAQITQDLSTFGNILMIRFIGSRGNDFTSDMAIDEVCIREPVTCPEPSALVASSITSSSAILGWTENGSATTWEIEFDTSGFTQGNGTVVSTGSNPYNLPGLMPETEYDFYVRSVCGPGDTSVWTGPGTFMTSCLPYSAPYFTDFDENASPGLPNCWSAIEDLDNTTSERVVTYSGTVPSAFSAPNSAELYNSSGLAANGSLLLISPQFSDLDNNKQIRFYAYDYSNASDLIIGTMTDPNDAMTFTPYDTLTEADMSDDVWEEHTITFDSYAGSDEYIAFAHGLNTTFDYLYVDDFNYEDIPTCPNPTSLVVNSVTESSANLSWMETGSATAWQVEYDTSGFTPGTGTIKNAGSNPYNLTGLMSSTSYDVYVRSVCGVGDTSAWSTVGSFTTDCGVQSVPYLHEFPVFPSSCWYENGNISGGEWESDEYLNNAANSNAVNINMYSLEQDTLFGPSIDLTSGGPHRMKWDIGLTNWNSTAADNFGSDDEVQVWISSNGGPWMTVETYNVGNQPATLGQTDSVDLTAYLGTTVQLAFFATGGTVDDLEDYDVHIDNVEVYEFDPGPCGLNSVTGTPASGTYSGLILSSDALIESGKNVIFKGEVRVDLDANFEVELGAEFETQQEDCP